PCTAGSLIGSAVNLTPGAGNNSSASSDSITPTAVGTYCFRGVYSGSTSYGGSSDATTDECFTVTAAPTTTVTSPSSGSIVLGGSIHDSAVVTGNATGGSPTGTVSFYVCAVGVSPCTAGSLIGSA